jgi:hypothetical protein
MNITSGSDARAISIAVVEAALHLHDSDVSGALHEVLLSMPSVHSVLAPAVAEASAQRELLVRLAIHLAREVLAIWQATYPDQHGPIGAVEAGEAWASCPCERHADEAAARQQQAVQQALAAWRPPATNVAWSGRTAAWVADAPKHGWQAVAAIVGACRATSTEKVIAAAEIFFARETSRRLG